MSAITRLTLQSAQQHRVWEASLLSTYLGPTDSDVIVAMREAGVRYHNEVQAADSARREQLGPPHVHVFGAMITALITQITRITPQPSSLDFLKQIATWLNASPLSAVMKMVTVARLSNTSANSCEQRVVRRSHQSGDAHSRHAPHVRDGPAGTPRAHAVEASGWPTDTGVILPAVSAETRLHMKRGGLESGPHTTNGPLAQILRFQSERSRQQSVSDSGDVILSPPVLSAVAHGLSLPAGVVPDTGEQTNDTHSQIRQATVHPNVPRDVLDSVMFLSLC